MKHCFYTTKVNATLNHLAVDSFKVMDFICRTEWLQVHLFSSMFDSKNLKNGSPVHMWHHFHFLHTFSVAGTR